MKIKHLKRWDKKVMTKIMNRDDEQNGIEFLSESEEEQKQTSECGTSNL